MTCKYSNWESFMDNGGDFLEMYPSEFYIEKGCLNFIITLDDKKYFCSGSECNVSDIYFNPAHQLRTQCDFDSFYMFECGNESNQICNW